MRFLFFFFAILLFNFPGYVFAKPLTDSVGVKNNDGKKWCCLRLKRRILITP